MQNLKRHLYNTITTFQCIIDFSDSFYSSIFIQKCKSRLLCKRDKTRYVKYYGFPVFFYNFSHFLSSMIVDSVPPLRISSKSLFSVLLTSFALLASS